MVFSEPSCHGGNGEMQPEQRMRTQRGSQQMTQQAIKYIFVTGGVASALGKGITSASLGRLLKSRGWRVTLLKFDPYVNVDS